MFKIAMPTRNPPPSSATGPECVSTPRRRIAAATTISISCSKVDAANASAGKSVSEVGDYVGPVLDSHRNANRPRADSKLGPLRRGHGAVRGDLRVTDRRLDAAQARRERGQREALDHPLHCGAAAFEVERHHPPRSVGQESMSHAVGGRLLKKRMVHARD